MPFSQVNTLRSNKNIAVQSAKVPLFLGLWLNHARAPFADLNVRKAMQYAIDRPLINKEIFDGLGMIPNTVLMSFAMDAPDSVVQALPVRPGQGQGADGPVEVPARVLDDAQVSVGHRLLPPAGAGAPAGVRCDRDQDQARRAGHGNRDQRLVHPRLRHGVPVRVIHQRHHRPRRVRGLPGQLGQRLLRVSTPTGGTRRSTRRSCASSRRSTSRSGPRNGRRSSRR